MWLAQLLNLPLVKSSWNTSLCFMDRLGLLQSQWQLPLWTFLQGLPWHTLAPEPSKEGIFHRYVCGVPRSPSLISEVKVVIIFLDGSS